VTLFGGPRAQTLEQFAALVGAPRWAFTGTRAVTGIPGAVERVEALLTAGVPTDVVWVVGGCVGIDAIVARVGTARGAHVHCVLPAVREQVDPHWRDYCSTYEEVAAGTTKADSYRKRNERLVAWISRPPAPAGRLVAFPEWPHWYRSGTWMTITIGHKAGVQIDIVPLREGPQAS
jgi:hypothetical protein